MELRWPLGLVFSPRSLVPGLPALWERVLVEQWSASWLLGHSREDSGKHLCAV